MKKKVFHQFIYLEKGPKNTAIIDFLEGNVYQVKNEIINKFEKGNYTKIGDFIELLEEESLIIEVEEKTWIPRMPDDMKEDKRFRFELEIEEGADLNLINEKFKHFEISRVIFYGKEKPDVKYPFENMIQEEKNFAECLKLSKVDGEFDEINESFYIFNKKYNSCWGQKLAITRDLKVRPCIYSELTIGDLKKENINDILDKAEEYWKITKDKVEKCKECEFRYVCFDCREIARRKEGNLYAANPNCKYDPYKGTWSE